MTTKNKEKYEGKVFSTKFSGDFRVVEYINYDTVNIEFLKTGYNIWTSIKEVQSGYIKDRMLPSVFGVGVIGNEVSKSGKKLDKDYSLWVNVLRRCYNPTSWVKHPTYQECEVSESFKYYPYFKEWCQNQIGFNRKGWQLDKDILVKGNKVYSEDTCCFVPREINVLFTLRQNDRGNFPIGVTIDKRGGRYFAQINIRGSRKKFGYSDTPEEAFYAYKQAKEAYIKEVAEEWKSEIDPRVYNALINYEVEITD